MTREPIAVEGPIVVLALPGAVLAIISLARDSTYQTPAVIGAVYAAFQFNEIRREAKRKVTPNARPSLTTTDIRVVRLN